MDKIFESYSDDANIKDGGFIFQAILNYDLRWSIIDGSVALDQNNISGWLKQVDVFPDMQFDEGYATLTYVILSEVNLLKRKFELASEAIKRIINPDYANEMDGIKQSEKSPEDLNQDQLDLPEPDETKLLGPGQTMLNTGQTMLNTGQTMLNTGQTMLNTGQKTLPKPAKQLPSPTSEGFVNEVVYTTKLTSDQIKEVNNKYFKGTKYDIVFTASNIVLREVSTSGVDSGVPASTLKASTGMVDTLDGKAINSWNNFKVVISGGIGNTSVITNQTEPKISEILVYDPIENINELIFRTILPSLVLEFRGDRVKIDNYSSRSTQISVKSNIDFDNLFNIEEAPKEIEEPVEGEDREKEPNEQTKNKDFIEKK